MPKHVPALDGVRGLAIVLVIAFHCRGVFVNTAEIPYLGFRLLSLGWCGVDLFFVLSGFLITGILLDTRDSPGRAFGFYSRRILRIFPLYFSYLFVVCVLGRYLWLQYSGRDLMLSTSPWWYVTYMINWRPGPGNELPLLGHLWSLAIEEQFYFVWPALVWLVPRRTLKWVCLFLIASAFVTRLALDAAGWPPLSVYGFTLSRLDCLAAGGLFAVGIRDFRPVLEKYSRPLVVICGVLFVEVAAVSPNPVWSDRPMRTLGALLLALFFGCIVFQAATIETGFRHRIFTGRFLRQCGKYSYGMYVFHVPLSSFATPYMGQLGTPPLPHTLPLIAKYSYMPAMLLLSFGAAWISWRFLEQPFLQLRNRLPFATRTSAAPLASRCSAEVI